MEIKAIIKDSSLSARNYFLAGGIIIISSFILGAVYNEGFFFISIAGMTSLVFSNMVVMSYLWYNVTRGATENWKEIDSERLAIIFLSVLSPGITFFSGTGIWPIQFSGISFFILMSLGVINGFVLGTLRFFKDNDNAVLIDF